MTVVELADNNLQNIYTPFAPDSPSSAAPGETGSQDLSALTTSASIHHPPDNIPQHDIASQSAPRNSKRRRSPSLSSDSTTSTQIYSGDQTSHTEPKRRRTDNDTMRLEGDRSKHTSPSRPFSNGSSNGSAKSPVLKAYTNGSSHTKSDTNGSQGSHTNGTSRPRQLPEIWHNHNREEVTRIIIQSLSDMGYHDAAGCLSRESGYELEGPTVAAFRNAVLEGEWEEAEALLFGGKYDDNGGVNLEGGASYAGKRTDNGVRRSRATRSPQAHTSGLKLAEGANEREMLFRLRQQKYLELLERRELGAALIVLRNELTPLHQDTKRLHFLSTLIMCPTPEELMHQSGWDGSSGQSRAELLSEISRSISPSIMIPEHRLSMLLDQVKENQIEKCLYHNTDEPLSLYHDHICEREAFPMTPVLELRHHGDEVWYLAFSNDGTKLASTSKDSTVVIYETASFQKIHTFKDHNEGVCYVAWSPDDSKLISCSQDKSARIWDMKSGRCLLNLDHYSDPVTGAVWAPDGNTFVIASLDIDKPLCIWNMQGERLHTWRESGLRVHDCAISPNGERLVATLDDSRLFVYDYVTRQKLAEWDLESKTTCVKISKDSREVLVNQNNSKIRLIDLETGEVIRTFEGLKQGEYVIRSNFGGAGQGYVISGSEDSNVYIWRKQSGELLASLEAHKPGCVNAVSWHPVDHSVFATAGDDNRVKIWSNTMSTLRGPAHANGSSSW